MSATVCNAPHPCLQVSDNVVNRIGHVGRAFGEAFGVEPWARELFAEEVVRGGPAFAVSLVLSSIEANLRKAADLGAWQVRRSGENSCQKSRKKK